MRLGWTALLVVLIAAPAAAQSTEIEVGGGFHVNTMPKGFVQLPHAPTVDVRAVRWLNERWGVAGRVMVGIGSIPEDEGYVTEHRNPMYVQVVARRQVVQSDQTEAHFGIGGGMLGWRETVDFGDGPEIRSVRGPHFLALEALVSQALTDRLCVRGGVTLVVPVHLHPVVLVAWRF